MDAVFTWGKSVRTFDARVGMTLAVSALLLVFLGSIGCQRVDRARQVRTHGKLQYLRAVVDDDVRQNGELPSLEQLRRLVSPADLLDAWGRPIVYDRFLSSGRARYVLASFGSDGKLDVGELKEYLDSAEERVDGCAECDIVVVDGSFVRNAGK
jgi:hypothetical protein